MELHNKENPLRFFADNVDKWGPAEWFERLVAAIEDHDEAMRNGDPDFAETCKMIATSTAFRLARDFREEIRASLAAPSKRAVSPLEWNENRRPRQRVCVEWYAYSELGDYWIEKKKRFWARGRCGDIGNYSTLEEAKAAVFARHEAIIHRSLL